MLSATPELGSEVKKEERKALTLDGDRAETLMYIVDQWAQLAGREEEAGRLRGKDIDRLRIVRAVIEEWALLGGGGLALPQA